MIFEPEWFKQAAKVRRRLPYGIKIWPVWNWPRQMTKSTLKADTLGGITVAMVLIPQAIAYAQLAGLPPQFGLYAALLPPAISALMGSSRFLATGPVAIISLLTAGAIATIDIHNPEFVISALLMLTLLVGTIQLGLGILKLGDIVNFISHPVLIGFSNAAVVLIAMSQLPKIFGVVVDSHAHLWVQTWQLLMGISTDIYWSSVVMALVGAGMLIFIRRFYPNLPAVLITVVVTTIIAWVLKLDYHIVGYLPQGLPGIPKLQWQFSTMVDLFNPALTIALLGFMESISVAKTLALKTGERIQPNQELMAQGWSNIAGAFSQGYPVAGSFSRTAVGFHSGTVSGFSSVVTSLVVLVTLLWLTPLLYYLPLPILAVVVIMSVLGLIRIDKLRETWNLSKSDGVIALITLFSTLAFSPDLDRGILLGVLLSAGYYIYSRSRPQVVELIRTEQGSWVEATSVFHRQRCQHIRLIRFSGSLFFANASLLENSILRMATTHHGNLKYIIVVASGINYIDSSGIEVLLSIGKRLKEIGINLLLVDVRPSIWTLLKKANWEGAVGPETIYRNKHEVLLAIYLQAHEGEHEPDCPLKSFKTSRRVKRV